MIHPEVRRIASRISTMSVTPRTMSIVPGMVLRSVKSSPPRSMYATTSTAAAAASQSHHMTR